MRTFFHHLLTYFFLVLVLSSLISCSPREEEIGPLNLLSESESSGVRLRIYSEFSDYFYTDRIPVILEFHSLSEGSYPLNDDALSPGVIWGDFRLYAASRISAVGYRLILQPLKPGTSVFRFPETIPFSGEFEIRIKSRLENLNSSSPAEAEGISEPRPLIRENKDYSWISVLGALSVLLILSGFFLYYRFIKNKKRERVSESPTLKSLLRELPPGTHRTEGTQSEGTHPEIDEKSCLEFYRSAYTVLLKDLSARHPGVRISDSPRELIHHLESPSPLNQWALRTLYPVLKDWEDCFFSPPGDIKINEKYDENIEILRGWIRFDASVDEEVKG